MFVGRVTGNLVATVKIPEHEGKKLMLVRRTDRDGRVYGPAYVALDGACAGIGDYVLFTLEGGAARMLTDGTISNSAIAGVLDHLPDYGE